MNLRIECRLTSPVSSEPPELDALLLHSVCRGQQPIQRFEPCPPFGSISIPLEITEIGWLGGETPVYRVSGPICNAAHDRHEFRQKYLDVNRFASLVRPECRHGVTATKFGWMKRYFRPMRVRAFDRIVWFAVGNRRDVVQLLERVASVGGDRGRGYGRVARWDVREWDTDWGLMAHCDGTRVLMRRVPAVFGEIEAGIVGASRWFGACQPPYYHPERQMEILMPC